MMRWPAISALLFLAGCNELLGVEDRELTGGGAGPGGAGGAGNGGGGGATAGGANEGGAGARCEDDPCAPGCVDLFSSEDHCGVCGEACPDGQACLSGVCDRRMQGAAGSYTMCARGDAGLACWGRNPYGQMGNGLVTDDDGQSPALVTCLPDEAEPLYAVSPIAATCALTADERLYCFGSNHDNALGIGTEGGPDDGVNDPGCCHYHQAVVPLFPPGTRVVDVVGGGAWYAAEFKCALDVEGDVYCWGAGASTLRQKVVPDAVQIVAGIDKACALTRDGEVWCWLAKSLGDNDVTLGLPTRVEDLPPIRLLGHTAEVLYAVSYSNEIFAAGPARTGLLGPSVTIDDNTYFPPVPFDWAAPSDIRQIVGTPVTACALLLDGDVHCWGRNGTQGDGTLEDGGYDPTPKKATIEDVVEIAASTHELIARTSDGQFYRWDPPILLPQVIVMPE